MAATLQVKNIDPELHAALATRAKLEGRTMSDLVVSMLRRELARPSIDDWIVSVRRG
ncbi:MAG: FitA-like ribbon-helix-helix domain-containing protein, partial [Jiangellaceae bacterium]